VNQASHATRPFLTAIGGFAATLLTPTQCWATDQPALPWDYTLDVMQHYIAGPLAQAVIVVSSIVAMLAFTLAGDSELARRFVKTVFGIGAALVAVQLLNYLVP
jgi:type IV secretory pathway VirB2 component (pilin)